MINWAVDLTVGGFEEVPLGVRHGCILAKSILENKTEIGGCENSVGCAFLRLGGIGAESEGSDFGVASWDWVVRVWQ